VQQITFLLIAITSPTTKNGRQCYFFVGFQGTKVSN